MVRVVVSALGVLVTAANLGAAADLDAVERGAKALQGRAFNPPAWTSRAYQNAWRTWDPKSGQTPANYAEVFRQRYGLHMPPYANGGYPMGLRAAQFLLTKGITTDCLLCHAGSIAGQSYIGLGNSSI